MLNKVVTAVISAVMILNSVSLFAAAPVSNKDSVSLMEVELLLEKQKMELERDVVIYSALGAGAITVAGGIYAYYTQKHLRILKQNNKMLADKLSQAENLLSTVAKENASFTKKISKNAKLIKGNKVVIEGYGEYIGQIVEALNQHSTAINSIVEGVEKVTAEAEKPRRPIGFHTQAQIEPEVAEDILSLDRKALRRMEGKMGIIGLLIAGGITVYYMYSSTNNTAAEINNKRVAFVRSLNNAYDNDKGFFIIDVLAHAKIDRHLTAAILHENIGSDKDFYARFVNQQKEADKLYKEAQLQRDFVNLSDNSWKMEINGLENNQISFNNRAYTF